MSAATLILAIGTCAFATTGENRLAQRMEHKLDDNYLLWYDVPVGPKQLPVMGPQRGPRSGW